MYYEDVKGLKKLNTKPKCDLAGCIRKVKYKATFTDKETGEQEIAYYCIADKQEAYDLRGLGMEVQLEKLKES